MSDLICRKTMQRCQTPGMCLPFQGCPDPMQRTMHAQLAAKDAEIAELRKLAACAYQAMGVHDAPDKWLDALSSAASGNPFETDSLLPYAPQAVCDAIAERDEARECVGRLYRSAAPFEFNVPYFDSRADADRCPQWQALREALAATPEHLR